MCHVFQFITSGNVTFEAYICMYLITTMQRRPSSIIFYEYAILRKVHMTFFLGYDAIFWLNMYMIVILTIAV